MVLFRKANTKNTSSKHILFKLNYAIIIEFKNKK